jgi:acyl-CoA synthetase (AMP-forming)/AMP-acid ligase II
MSSPPDHLDPTSPGDAGETLAAVLGGGPADAPALVVPGGGPVLGFGLLAEAVGELAGVLSAAGVARGDRVALVLPDGPTFVQALLAVTLLGAAAAPLNPAYTRDEYAFYLEDLDPRLVLLPPDDIAAARAAAPATATVAELSMRDGRSATLAVDGRAVAHGRDFERATPEDVALLLHTSGTTSRPKQVPLLHRNLMASTRAIGAHYQLGPEDASYCAMPLFHVHGLVASTFAALAAGGRAVVPPRFTPQRLLEHVGPEGITWFSAGPTMHQSILERVERRGEAPQGLRFLRSCSSALSPELMRRVEDRFGAPLLEAYGMTEASHQIASNPLPPAPREPGSVGIATGTEIRIADPQSGLVLPLGESGEVQIRGRGLTSGYLNNLEATAEAFADGWFRTGDIGTLDADGYLRLEGRLKEMIIRGGENISPAEIEDVLRAHPSVADAVCFGMPDEKYGEQVAAAVALREPADEGLLRAHCGERLAAFKVPRTILVVDAIPRTPTGKLQRRRVAAQLGVV